LLALVHGFGVFSSKDRGRDEKWWMSVRVDLQSIPTGYFIDRRDALGVMTGQYTLLEYQTAGFSPRREGFLLEQCLWIAESGSSVNFAPRGRFFSRVRLKIVPGCVQKENKIHGCKT
jgi:hypothetical protein